MGRGRGPGAGSFRLLGDYDASNSEAAAVSPGGDLGRVWGRVPRGAGLLTNRKRSAGLCYSDSG